MVRLRHIALGLALGVLCCTGTALAGVKVVPGGGTSIHVDAAIDEYQDVQLQLTGVHGRLHVDVDPSSASIVGGADLAIFRVDATTVNGKLHDDPLPALAENRTVDGDVRLLLRFDVPRGTAAGAYSGLLHLTVDGASLADVPVTLSVWDVTLPSRDDPNQFRALFNMTPQAYINAVNAITHSDPNVSGPAIGDSLMHFLSEYRIDPGDWGYATPRHDGYVDHVGWWRKARSLMETYGSYPFAMMRLPIDTQRAHESLTGLRPSDPSAWVGYLRRYVESFWQSHGWLSKSAVWGWDEPGSKLEHSVIRNQACATHAFNPETQYMVTASPLEALPPKSVTVPWASGHRTFTTKGDPTDNSYLWDGKGCDDVDIWVILDRRYYGTWRSPVQTWARVDMEHRYLRINQTAKKHGAQLWSYTYTGTPGSPGYAVGEPSTNPEMLMLWNALEGIDGTLYADGMMTYRGRNPYQSLYGDGQHALIYPARIVGDDPVSSLRLEGIREGIEDADLAQIVAARYGQARVRSIMAEQGLFSISHGKVQLGCTLGCDFKTGTTYAFPRYRTDAGTAAAILRVHRAFLRALASPPAAVTPPPVTPPPAP